MKKDKVFIDEKTIKKAQRKMRLKAKVGKVKKWCIDNKELIVIFGPVVIGYTVKLVQFAGRAMILNKKKAIKDLYCYDRSLGHYWALRRELTNKEWVEIDKRKRNGERLADILQEFKVLK